MHANILLANGALPNKIISLVCAMAFKQLEWKEHPSDKGVS